MYIEQSSFLTTIEVTATVVGLVIVPFLIWFLSENTRRKSELDASHTAQQQARESDQKYLATHLGELRDRVTKLQTTVDIKRETVDSVQAEQNRVGVRVAVVESNVTSIRESQARSEQNWLKVSEKLEILGRIEETVKNLADDMREVRAEQSKQSE